MEFERETTRLLHDEHMAVLALLERLEGLLGRHGPGDVPDVGESAVNLLLGDLIATLETETVGHFRFEEESVFPRLAEAGDGTLGELLNEEHEVILPLSRRLTQLAREARGSAFTPASWKTFHSVGREFVERLTDHIEKEEMGLLPLVEELLDAAHDNAIAAQHPVNR